MKRREFVAALAGAATVAPVFRAKAQRRRTIAYFAPARTQHLIAAFQNGLRDLGYVEGQNLTIDYRFASERNQTLEAAASDLVARAPDVIVVVGVATATAAKRATATIPIVFAPAGDPVRSGLVPSLASPGGNLTGVSLYASELNEKRLEVFKEAFPNLRRLGALANSRNLSSAGYWDDLRVAAEHMRMDLRHITANGISDLETKLANATAEGVDGLIVDRATRDRAPPPDDVRAPRLRRGGRPDVIRSRHRPPQLPGRHLCRQDHQGREARRPADRAAHNTRACRQFESSESSRPHHPTDPPRPRRRGDRMRTATGPSRA